jgi:hypothetical protein
MNDCGGCRGEGSHKRWCLKKVGYRASRIGTVGEDLEDIGDLIGASNPLLANRCYGMARELLIQAGVEANR